MSQRHSSASIERSNALSSLDSKRWVRKSCRRSADDALWTELKRHFSEPELVELGFLVGVLSGGQRWIHTLDLRHGDVATESKTGYRPELAEKSR